MRCTATVVESEMRELELSNQNVLTILCMCQHSVMAVTATNSHTYEKLLTEND